MLLYTATMHTDTTTNVRPRMHVNINGPNIQVAYMQQ